MPYIPLCAVAPVSSPTGTTVQVVVPGGMSSDYVECVYLKTKGGEIVNYMMRDKDDGNTIFFDLDLSKHARNRDGSLFGRPRVFVHAFAKFRKAGVFKSSVLPIG